VIDHGFLLAQRLEVDAQIVDDVDDRVGFRLHLVDQRAARVDAGDALVGVGDARQQQVHLVLEGGHFAALLRDVGQVGLAARANLVDLLYFGLDGVDQLLTGGNRGDALFEIAGELRDLRQPCFD
jgi:hypothetical protein